MGDTQVEDRVVRVSRDGHVATVELDNPPMNVITLEVGAGLLSACEELGADDSVRVVVFRSANPGIFSAGADVNMLAEAGARGEEGMREFLAGFDEIADVFDHVAALPQPTVAALEGIALGGGFELALACDFRIAADDLQQVGLPEVRLGLLPGGGGTQRLPRLVGAGVATEMLMKGMRYDAETALAKGLVHKVVPAAELRAETDRYALGLARQAPLALRHMKALVRAAFESAGPASLADERQRFIELVRSSDAQEGIGAAIENRRAAFTGT